MKFIISFFLSLPATYVLHKYGISIFQNTGDFLIIIGFIGASAACICMNE